MIDCTKDYCLYPNKGADRTAYITEEFKCETQIL